jgi:hypothetical protein
MGALSMLPTAAVATGAVTADTEAGCGGSLPLSPQASASVSRPSEHVAEIERENERMGVWFKTRSVTLSARDMKHHIDMHTRSRLQHSPHRSAHSDDSADPARS